jgi:hypothetical protein
MNRIWMAVEASSKSTRVLATAGPGDTLLKARLAAHPRHLRALDALLEAVALWQGQKVHAALCVDEAVPSYGPSPWRSIVAGQDTPLYALERVPPRRRERRPILGMGDFRSLHRMLRSEVAR